MNARVNRAAAGLVWTMAVALAPAAVSAQAGPPPPADRDAAVAPSAPPPAPQPPRGQRGLFGDLGRLFEPPAAAWPWAIKTPAEAIEDFNARARDAGDSLSRLGRTPVVTGRASCPVAANGAPDCQTAADRLCRDKGFRSGKTMDVESAEVCSARALLSGRTDEKGACRMRNYVTRVMCQ